ncbi:related to RSM22-Mitochondrial ribosomal protein,small subunit [Zygosaccharomyces bailii ISA1307]|uniref:BN860_03334g1_1 n=1 Tax=Zygosaccharomyces bailii (strain CLIB 213 / ATCC 58445 / CBS 680 / BCRC 21525 / NBRC 1098 / NCYC 1416 / NRRL Y-2227) TaxID=1333698 RepID=A0A8J2X5V4_ZYGB2|nr:BN860_03334g1_1 [Zygosaccharomyces bailii CLIB 213]CDH14960.1 related to RSM22-Mitochondrial ribosomal protein,small subunit [Zygosaccharomyces bailii ISA1307]
MLRSVGLRVWSSCRLHSSFPKEALSDLNFDLGVSTSNETRHQKSFGHIVEGEKANNSTVVDREQLMSDGINSDYRNEAGEPVRGKNAQEARLRPQTLQGRTNRAQLDLDPEISKAINNHILLLQLPNNVRRASSKYFAEMHETKVHRPARTKMEVDSHIASLFLQNYGAIYQSLAELQKRVGAKHFNPKRILDVGYGPATGMVALNDLMGEHFYPDVKEAVILSCIDMEKKAKIILGRQLNEIQWKSGIEQGKTEEENDADDIEEEDELVGEVMTKKIKINTTLRNTIPGTSAGSRQYDLIILTHQLLKSEERFPIQIDENLEHFLGMLAPGGHLVIIEKGNPLGFETIARARQVMIRPENYPDEHGKIPRPYNSNNSPGYDIEVTDSKPEINSPEADMLLKDLDKQYGIVQDEELNFEPELLDAISREKEASAEKSYYLKVIAPCPHHRKCPLQIGKPQYYGYAQGENLKFCNFQKSIARPKYTMEHKKGKLLATPWQEPTDGIGKRGLAKPGTGRPNGRNYEILNYSYLIMERCQVDVDSVQEIERQRANPPTYEVGSLGDNTQATWPRLIKQPLKRKGHVIMDLCGASGELEKWIVPKSYGKEAYHDARKATKGDLWALNAKTKIKSSVNINVEKFETLEKEKIKLLKKEAKKRDRQVSEAYNELTDGGIGDVDTLAKVLAHDYQQGRGKKDKKYDKMEN